jgi:hypothetical protein
MPATCPTDMATSRNPTVIGNTKQIAITALEDDIILQGFFAPLLTRRRLLCREPRQQLGNH